MSQSTTFNYYKHLNSPFNLPNLTGVSPRQSPSSDQLISLCERLPLGHLNRHLTNYSTRLQRLPPLKARADDISLAADTSAAVPLHESTAVVDASIRHMIASIYRFTRPHTMLGTLISVLSVSCLALGPQGFTQPAITALSQALSSALLMNVCIVGINQLYDVEIDRVNKPYLPLAAGDFSMATGVNIVLITGALSLIVGGFSGSTPLLTTLIGSLLLGIAYSSDLPFLRWKRYPVAAASCILAVRAVLVQLGFYFHMQQALGSSSLAITRPVAFATSFMLIFSIVIALFKDIPDIRGDSKAGVNTLSVRLGPKRVFWTCILLLEVAYIGAVTVGLGSEYVWSRIATTVSHAGMAGLIYWRALRTDLTSSKSIYACYMDVWKAFYAEYLLLPLFR